MHRIKVHCLILCMLSSFSCFSKKSLRNTRVSNDLDLDQDRRSDFFSKLIFFSTSSSILAKKRKHNALERSKFKVFTSDDDDDMHRLKDYLYESMTECCST